MPIIAAIPDEERRLMRKEARQTRDKNYSRRLIAMLMLHQGMTVTEVTKMLCAARSWLFDVTLHRFTLHRYWHGLAQGRADAENQKPVL